MYPIMQPHLFIHRNKGLIVADISVDDSLVEEPDQPTPLSEDRGFLRRAINYFTHHNQPDVASELEADASEIAK